MENSAVTQDLRATDDKGRTVVSEMTDRELMEEVAHNLRALADVLEALGSHPMAGALGLRV